MYKSLSLQMLVLLIAVFTVGSVPANATTPILVEDPPDFPLGLDTAYFKESDAELGISEALAAFHDGSFHPGDTSVLNFGIGSRPTWIGLEVANNSVTALQRRLSLETSWLDKVDFYVLSNGNIVASYKMGDSLPFSERPITNRFFNFDHAYAPGISEVLIRVETHDPMVIPLHLRNIGTANDAERWQNYGYGFVYGFLLALIAYNGIIFIGLRSLQNLYYSVYLTLFMLLNIAYTGHGYAWLWPNQAEFQLWIIPFMMLLFGMSGLLFASSFLDTRANFPRMHRAIVLTSVTFALLMLVLFIVGNNALHMATAFAFLVVFSCVMLLLGVLSVSSGYKPARYFLFGAISAMSGVLLTDLSVAGFVPFSPVVYRAVEIGMMADAFLLALALTYQFRINQKEKFDAEKMARMDPLTGLSNRRGFYEYTKAIWSNALRKRRDVSVILFDIDEFKKINDSFGHASGDEALIAVASILTSSAREGDVSARWGGEEFIVFMPETNNQEAAALAERLRMAISDIRVKHAKGMISFTASFGVAQRTESCGSIEELTSVADKLLFQSKLEGRNRVSHNVSENAS